MRPLLITFSGIDGAGKSTQIEKLRQYLVSEGVAVRILTFWDSIAVFRSLRSGFSRKVLQSDGKVGTRENPAQRKDKNRQAWPLLGGRSLLYLLDVFSLRRIVRKVQAESSGVVLFDRYIYDQLAALPIHRRLARTYAGWVLGLTPQPDISYLLDADPEAARARKPEYPLEFLRTYRASYLELQKLAQLQLIAPADPEHVHAQIVMRFEELLSANSLQPQRMNSAALA